MLWVERYLSFDAMLDDSPASGLPCPDLAVPGQTVRLRPWRASDAAGLLSVFSDPDVQRFSWPHSRAYTLDDAERYLLHQAQARRAGQEVQWAIVDSRTHGLAGGVTLYAVEAEERRACVGYWLAPHARGQGLATQSVSEVARWAFTALGLARLQLTCGPDNHASQAVADRCGFTREGLLRSHMPFKGTRRDSLVFSLLDHELEAAATEA